MTADTVVWPVHELQRVFLPDPPPRNASALVRRGWHLFAARGEYCSVQIGLHISTRIDPVDVSINSLSKLRDIAVSVTAPVSRNKHSIPAELFRTRWVDSVSIHWAALGDAQPERPELIPGLHPDPLVDEPPYPKTISGRPYSLAIHLSFQVPRTLPPATYHGAVHVSCGRQKLATIPLTIDVWPVAIPASSKFHFSHFLTPDDVAKVHDCEPWSERHWRLLDLYAQDMAEHRTNVILTPTIFPYYLYQEPLFLVDTTLKADGSLVFDMRRLERWIKLFDKHGFQLFELAWFAGFDAKNCAPPFVVFDEKKNKQVWHWDRSLDHPLYRRLAGAFLEYLSAWLEKRNLTDRFLLHVFDEPARPRWDDYVKRSAWLRSHAPRIRQIEGINHSDLLTKFGAQIDVPVPNTQHVDGSDGGYYRELARQGEKPVWWYTCCGPIGRYANRMLYQPLIEGRMLFWQSYVYRMSGYLHWGYNWWSSMEGFHGPNWHFNPHRRLRNPYHEHPPIWNVGDCCIVYPPQKWWEDRGPVSSLRYEALRAGLQDYELLKMLNTCVAEGKGNAQALKRGRAILQCVQGPFAGSLTEFSRDADELFQLRRATGECLSALL